MCNTYFAPMLPLDNHADLQTDTQTHWTDLIPPTPNTGLHFFLLLTGNNTDVGIQREVVFNEPGKRHAEEILVEDYFPKWGIKTLDAGELAKPARGKIKHRMNYSPCAKSLTGHLCSEKIYSVAELNPQLKIIIHFIWIHHPRQSATVKNLRKLQSLPNVELDILTDSEYIKLFWKGSEDQKTSLDKILFRETKTITTYHKTAEQSESD